MPPWIRSFICWLVIEVALVFWCVLFVFFLAKLCRWSGDIREGAKDYHYFKQKGWKGRRGKHNWTELGTLDDMQLWVDESCKQKIVAKVCFLKEIKKNKPCFICYHNVMETHKCEFGRIRKRLEILGWCFFPCSPGHLLALKQVNGGLLKMFIACSVAIF